jgi:hypothetical protein
MWKVSSKKIWDRPLNSGLYLFILLVFFTGCNKREPLRISFTGDVILDRGVSDETTIYGDSIINNSVKKILNGDFNVINLETVLTKEVISTKRGYSFSYNPLISNNLKLANVTHASVANNHSFDFGHPGYQNTISSLTNSDIVALGSNCEPVFLAKANQSVGILAVSLVSDNNHLCIKDRDQLLEFVEAFNNKHTDIPLIIYLHWGLEYQRKPEAWQIGLAHTLIDNGVDAIIGHHPHVFQNIEYYRGKPIVYSLGNFIADAYLPNTTKGAVAMLTFESNDPILSIQPIGLESYLPSLMNKYEQVKFLLDNLKYSNNMCYYLSGNQWIIKDIEHINFKENTSEWLFHVENEYQISIKRLSNGSHKMTLFRKEIPQKSMAIHGELSEIQIADVTNDKSPELLLGVTKKVNFDRSEKKRLNVYKIKEGGIKVIWLGTHLLYDLYSFQVIETDRINYLHTVEKDSINQLYKATYQWDEFGFALETIKNYNEKN